MEGTGRPTKADALVAIARARSQRIDVRRSFRAIGKTTGVGGKDRKTGKVQAAH